MEESYCCEEVLKSVLVAIVVTFVGVLKILEVIVIDNKTSYLLDLDDCYCYAC